jgi:formylglycine-generating enzyme required for sulfatase activity
MKATVTVVALTVLWSGCAQVARDLVVVRGGSFQMGNTFEGGEADERPPHSVELRSYAIGKHEVTVGQFRQFVEATGYVTSAERAGDAKVFVGKKVETRPDASWKNPYFEQDDGHPVVCVSWYDAVEYCNWRSRREGLPPCYRGSGDTITCDFTADGYRLPTEAEWEFAARSRGLDCRYAWGNGEPYIGGRRAGNTRDEAARRQWGSEKIWSGYDDGYAFTAPAGSFAPNALGLHDVSGNVYEWCWDWYGEEYYAHSPVQNPTGPPSAALRTCRDAGFSCPVERERVANRGKGQPDLAFSWGGFRVARTLPDR